MNALRITKLTLAAACLFTLSACLTSTAHAQSFELRQTAPSGLPRLGFFGHMEFGYGMVVDSVPYGTAAYRLGLEPGDMIVAVNRQRIASEQDYNSALYYSGGRGVLIVRNVRTGRLEQVPFQLDNGRGPISFRHEVPSAP